MKDWAQEAAEKLVSLSSYAPDCDVDRWAAIIREAVKGKTEQKYMPQEWMDRAADRIETLSHDKVAAGSYIGEPEIIQIIESCAPRCDRCQHWHRLSLVPGPFGQCRQTLKLHAYGSFSEHADDIRTAEDFGCVQFEEKSE